MAKMYVKLEDARIAAEKILDNAFNHFIRECQPSAFMKSIVRKDIFPLQKPKITWRKMGFCIAGSAYLMKNEIVMNINYLFSPDAERFIKKTTLHELAHIISFHHGGRNHDSLWKFIASWLGDDGERCHNYALPENRPPRNRYNLQCECCGKIHEVTIRRYRNYESYRCRCDKENGKLIQL